MKNLFLAALALSLAACATYQDGYGYDYQDGAYYGEESDYRYDGGYGYSQDYPSYGYGYQPSYYPSYGYGSHYRSPLRVGVYVGNQPYYSGQAYGYGRGNYGSGYYGGSGYGYGGFYSPRYSNQQRNYSRYRSGDGVDRLPSAIGIPVEPGTGSLRGRTSGNGMGNSYGGGYSSPTQGAQSYEQPNMGGGSRMGISESLRPAQRDQPTMDSGAFSAPRANREYSQPNRAPGPRSSQDAVQDLQNREIE